MYEIILYNFFRQVIYNFKYFLDSLKFVVAYDCHNENLLNLKSQTFFVLTMDILSLNNYDKYRLDWGWISFQPHFLSCTKILSYYKHGDSSH